MFTLEITRCPHPSILGVSKTFLNQVSIGKKGDILIPDPLLQSIHLKLVVTPEQEFLCFLSPRVNSILINGKITNYDKKVKIGDRFSIGDSEFLLREGLYTNFARSKVSIDENLKAIMTEDKFSLQKKAFEFLKNLSESGET